MRNIMEPVPDVEVSYRGLATYAAWVTVAILVFVVLWVYT